jgi:LPS export ABC transporter protein LptC
MKNRLVQAALSLALLGLLIQIVLVAPGQIRDAETKAALLPSPDMSTPSVPVHGQNAVDQTISGFHMIETQDGRKEWEVESEKASSIKAKNLWQLENVKTVFFSESGVTFTVTGKIGIVHAKSKDLRVEGDVVTRSSNGYVFRSESFDYISKYINIY